MLSHEKRCEYENELKKLKDERASAGVEWFPSKSVLFNLDREIRTLEDTLAFDDHEKDRLNKDKGEELEI